MVRPALLLVVVLSVPAAAQGTVTVGGKAFAPGTKQVSLSERGLEDVSGLRSLPVLRRVSDLTFSPARRYGLPVHPKPGWRNW